MMDRPLYKFFVCKTVACSSNYSYVKQYNKKIVLWYACNLYGEDDKFKYERSHYVSSLIDKIYILNTWYWKTIRQFMYAGDLAKK